MPFGETAQPTAPRAPAPLSGIALLLSAQNADGGWGYFPGKSSWLEPTAYALLALEARPGNETARQKAWRLIESWALPGGGYRLSAQVAERHWSSALCVTLHCVRKQRTPALDQTVDWLAGVRGAERGWLERLRHWWKPDRHEADISLSGWPWRDGNSSWVEPTAHTLVALAKYQAQFGRRADLAERLSLGQAMLVDRRCEDFGWNYGNRKVLREILPSYPETTAMALLGLQGAEIPQRERSFERAARWYRESRSPLARAWLRIALRNANAAPSATPEPADPPAPGDLLVTALEALGDDGHRFLSPEAAP